jgi:hypothetical protein
MSGRRKFGNGFCNGCNGCQEEGRRNYDIMFAGAVERCSTYLAALFCLY